MIKSRVMDSVNDLPQNARVFIYGNGAAGNTLDLLIGKLRGDISVLGYINTYKKGKSNGKKVFKFSEFISAYEKEDYDLILIASIYRDEISELLEKKGIKKSVVFKTPGAMNINRSSNGFLEFFRIFLIKTTVKILSLFIREKKGKFIIVGEYGGKFVGNSKYFFLYLKNIGIKNLFWLIKGNKKEENSYIKDYILRYLLLRTIYHLISAEFLIFDNRDWVMNYELLYYTRAKKIQLWHGVGFKYIEKMLLPEGLEDLLSSKENKLLKRRYPDYDLLVTTSKFYADNVFSSAFGIPIKKISLSGYPRNDIMYGDISGSLFNTDKEIIEEAIKKKEEGYRIILYAPTFRDLRNCMDYNVIFKSSKFDDFLTEHKILFVVKSHSIPAFKDEFDEGIKNLRIYEKTADIYPLFKYVDLLITDYSSIYMDFLHLNHPVLYYVFDLAEYKRDSRSIQFDFDEMTPGPKAKDFTELLKWIKYFLIDSKDGFEGHREKVRNLAFKFKDGKSSERIYKELIGIDKQGLE